MNRKSVSSAGQFDAAWVDGVSSLWQHFSRFGWDVLGLNLIALALVTLLGLTRVDSTLSTGPLLRWWVSIINYWVGIGSYMLALTIGLLGWIALRKTIHLPFKINLGKVLALEGAAFCLIALAGIAGGHLLQNAESGKDGGIVGWGLVELLEFLIPTPFSTALLILLLVVFLLYSTGLMNLMAKASEWWAAKLELGDESTSIPLAPVNMVIPDEVSAAVPARTELPPQSRRLKKEDKLPAPVPQAENTEALKAHRENLPPLSLLSDDTSSAINDSHIHDSAAIIEKTLGEFGVPARVIGFRVGPTVTQYAVEPGFIAKKRPDGSIIQQKVRVAQITQLERDLALRLSASRLRIESPVPGYSFIGIEAPNPISSTVHLRSLMLSEAFLKAKSPLAVVMGRDVSGLPVVADLARMPHLLIAGMTGSGKSIGIQALATCLIMNNQPEDLRLAMLDPKMVELVRFNGLPHLFGKVEVEVERMLGILRWAIVEMENRYKVLENNGVRDMETYNRRARRRGEKTFPRIVILIDELADLMATAPDQTEFSLSRLAQMARATSIHLLVATQRPSTDVITGKIKANFPARVAFAVTSGIDSRVILDSSGAEDLLGSGDMLFLNPEVGVPVRIQGAYVTDKEIERVVEYWKTLRPPKEGEAAEQAAPWEEHIGNGDDDGDNLIQQAVDIVRQSQHASASLLQRRLHIGYPRAAHLIDELEDMDVVGPSQGGGKERDVLIPRQGDEEAEE